MTSKFKDLIEGTPPLSSEKNTEEKAPPSEQSASSEQILVTTHPTKEPSRLILSAAKREKAILDAMFLKAAFTQLKKIGLAKSFKVLSKGGTTVEEIQIVLDPRYWTEDLDLLLSEGVVNEKP